MTPSHDPFMRKTRNVPRRDYQALNNGIDSLLPPQPDEELQDYPSGIDSTLSDDPLPFESTLQALGSLLPASNLEALTVSGFITASEAPSVTGRSPRA
jgi:hypothetical protein